MYVRTVLHMFTGRLQGVILLLDVFLITCFAFIRFVISVGTVITCY